MSQVQNSVTRFLGSQRNLAVLAVGGVAAALLSSFISSRSLMLSQPLTPSWQLFWAGYLVAFLFFVQFPLGCLAFFLIQNLMGVTWARSLSIPLRAGSRTLKYFVLLFLPIIGAAKTLYPWLIDATRLQTGQGKYLNYGFFAVRALAYLLIWAGIGNYLEWVWRTARRDLRHRVKLQYLSAWGLVALALTISFAAFDWMMSLEPAWHSTVYGLMIIVGQGVAALAALLIYHWHVEWQVHALSHSTPQPSGFEGELLTVPETPKQIQQERTDIANLLLTYIMTWAYLSFMQFLIIWSGNLPSEASWYLHRTEGTWGYFPAVLASLGFALPFVFFLSRKAKANRQVMLGVALTVLLSRALDIYWLVMPALTARTFINFLPTVFLGIGMAALVFGCYRREALRCR